MLTVCPHIATTFGIDDAFLFLFGCYQKANLELLLRIRGAISSHIFSEVLVVSMLKNLFASEKEENVVGVDRGVKYLVQLGALTVLNSAFHRIWHNKESLALKFIVYRVEIPECDDSKFLALFV